MQLTHFFSSRKRRERAIAASLYEGIMAGALASDLYQVGLAEDTFMGRFQQVALHGALVMRQLRVHGPFGRAVSQRLYEMIFSGFDHAYRETGIGDSSISRKVRKLGEEFYGLARGLDAALEDGASEALIGFVRRNGLGGKEPQDLSDYLRRTNKDLSQQLQSLDGFVDLHWPSVINRSF